MYNSMDFCVQEEVIPASNGPSRTLQTEASPPNVQAGLRTNVDYVHQKFNGLHVSDQSPHSLEPANILSTCCGPENTEVQQTSFSSATSFAFAGHATPHSFPGSFHFATGPVPTFTPFSTSSGRVGHLGTYNEIEVDKLIAEAAGLDSSPDSALDSSRPMATPDWTDSESDGESMAKRKARAMKPLPKARRKRH